MLLKIIRFSDWSNLLAVSYYLSIYVVAVPLPPDLNQGISVETMFSELHVMKYGVINDINSGNIIMASTT